MPPPESRAARQATNGKPNWQNEKHNLFVQGPEIRTGFLENAKPIQLTAGKEVTLTTDYEKKGNSGLIAVR